MKVFVLIGVQGEDPPEPMLLGVFKSRETAEEMKEEIDTRTSEYWLEVCKCAEDSHKKYEVWLNEVSAIMKGQKWPNGWLEQFHAMKRMIDISYCRVLVSEGSETYNRPHFERTAIHLAEKTLQPPALPPIVPSPKGPLLNHYQMSIQEAEVQS